MSDAHPEVGDLVLAVTTDTKWVCTDIIDAKTHRPVWLLRPLYGSVSRRQLRVDRDDLVSYSVIARRGEWIQP
ncbi:hypothetical protein [Streptomyces sp. NPDC093097]|uniref:hypothetical protein n=1 Tax=Streptomyces sp. NPDC093097 TaxID=3366027 RepID=UPI003818F833